MIAACVVQLPFMVGVRGSGADLLCLFWWFLTGPASLICLCDLQVVVQSMMLRKATSPALVELIQELQCMGATRE